MIGRGRWLLIASMLAATSFGACDTASAQDDPVGDMGPPDDALQGEPPARDSWGTGFEDDDTFGDTDAFDDDGYDDDYDDDDMYDDDAYDDDAYDDDAYDDIDREAAARDSWGTGFEDDDAFGDTDAFDDDAFGDTERLDRRPES